MAFQKCPHKTVIEYLCRENPGCGQSTKCVYIEKQFIFQAQCMQSGVHWKLPADYIIPLLSFLVAKKMDAALLREHSVQEKTLDTQENGRPR